ncbi:alpha/beta fold hydrolase [Peterkaempfera sp. SMS 1(5)a]|uniref:alpha/beta fold hydrolase n=1 Tax=Peterkaempfera podocarpi TaxID=3232308 RepID=UPI00366DA4F1
MDPTAVRRRTVHSAGLPLAVAEQGDPARPTVLLVHGYPDTRRVWDEIAAELAADHHVVRYDVRGAGDSGVPESRAGYRLELLAADLLAVADAVSPGRPVHLVAHDWGSLQSWEAVTAPGAEQWIASYTSISGPCLDHVGHWYRERLSRPTPHGLRQLFDQSLHSWYIAAFHVPVLAPAVWRLGLARIWGRLLARAEGVRPRPGHPQPTLARDAARGIELYRANFIARVARPGHRSTAVPVQLVTLSGDRFVRPALSEGLERWVPRLERRTLRAGHWSALLERAPEVAELVRAFAARTGSTEREQPV